MSSYFNNENLQISSGSRSRPKKRRMSSRSRVKNEIITPELFHLTQQHHKKCLRQLFLQHYEPVVVDGRFQVNREWTVNLNKQLMRNLRLHLTWVLKGEVFHWTDEQTGKRILKIFSELGKTSISTFVTHVQ